MMVNNNLVGGFNHLEKNSQCEGLSHILWTNNIHVPNQQPVYYFEGKSTENQRTKRPNAWKEVFLLANLG